MAAASERLSGYFSARSRHWGQLTFRAGRVVITSATSEEVVATIYDDQEQRVRLRLADGRLIAGCTCSHFDSEGTPCKHVWSVLLAAEAEGHLNGPALPGNGQLVWDTEWRAMAWDAQRVNTADSARATPVDTEQKRRRLRGGTADEWREWVEQIGAMADQLAGPLPPSQRPVYAVLYVFDIPATFRNEHLVLQVLAKRKRPDGTWAAPVPRSPARLLADGMHQPPDSWILQCLAGPQSELVYVRDNFNDARSQFLLEPGLRDVLVPLVTRTGRCYVRKTADGPLEPLSWDEGPDWEPEFQLVKAENGQGWILRGFLKRRSRRMTLTEPLLLLSGGMVFYGNHVARLADGYDFPWLAVLRRNGELLVPPDQIDELIDAIYRMPALPRLKWPRELKLKERSVQPTPIVRIQTRTGKNAEGRSRAHALLAFDYGGIPVGALDKRPYVADLGQRIYMPRDWEYEQQVKAQLNTMGFRQGYALSSTRGPAETERYQISPKLVQRAIRRMLKEGWYVELSGQRVRTNGSLRFEIHSHIDWFELRGEVRFGDQTVGIPELLAALRRSQETITLKDGSKAYIPQEWREQFALLAAVATTRDKTVSYHRSQVGLLDALLAARSDVQVDEEFKRLRDRLKQFEGVVPADPPKSFCGSLREYQRDGLGWFHFLQQFGFGGCLADDMGLGKTVQVIALLEERRLLRAAQPKGGRKGRRKRKQPEQAVTAPSLVVVPRSLVFNWKAEIEKFAPQMRVLDHTGADRAKTTDCFDQYDVILTTYGTLRRDIVMLKDFKFDYIILDEAQAIKNAHSETSRAVRLLQGTHRLALSGTPIENHLGELWSLFEFLNPGMLGSARVFRDRVGPGKVIDESSRQVLARALRPFILRRTKAQVAKDLPERVEQTLVCEMSAEQQKLYDDLRDHYRATLLGHVREHGMAKSTMHVLEALLRLRQAACHPGLISEKHRDCDGGKLELLLEQLDAVCQEGHKALVFSQFTSLLALIRERLDQRGLVYEYLDGQTRDRQARVKRFQTDDSCQIFLISLKAGGVGLNLTAAEYVFLVDPWWNPAVEAQAIDRAHRIGQTRKVFAYKLISKNTVEEKILQLQSWKKDLAASIITSENSFLKNLTAEDLELLLT